MNYYIPSYTNYMYDVRFEYPMNFFSGMLLNQKNKDYGAVTSNNHSNNVLSDNKSAKGTKHKKLLATIAT